MVQPQDPRPPVALALSRPKRYHALMRETLSILDARGHRLPVRAYGRVASLVPSLTETVVQLGKGASLVARTVYCTEPRDQLTHVPTFGGTKNPDLTALQGVRPDLVLSCLEENKPQHLHHLELAGIPVFAVMPRRLDDVSALLRDVGKLLGAEMQAGRALADLTAARLACGDLRARLPHPTTPPRVAVLIWKNPWMAAGGGTYINAVCGEMGLENALAGRLDYFTVSLDELADLNLDLVLLPDEPYKFTHHDAWSLAAASVVGDRRRAVLLDGRLLSWYGTRTAPSLRALARLLKGRL